MVGLALHLEQRTGCKSLCMSGGVALNCVANAKIKEQTPYENIYVPSAPSDAGVSLGAALYLYHRLTGKFPQAAGVGPFLGPEFSFHENVLTLKRFNMKFKVSNNPGRDAAGLLAAGKIIGWFQGRMEFGPRALGARSILAPPFPAEMKDIVNRRGEPIVCTPAHALTCFERTDMDVLFLGNLLVEKVPNGGFC